MQDVRLLSSLAVGLTSNAAQAAACITPASQTVSPVYIYTLACALTGEVRYVGKTIDLRTRLMTHKSKRSNVALHQWIRSLLNSGSEPVMELLETLYEADDTSWKEAERFWIATLRFYGCRLLNLDKGGNNGRTISPQVAEKVSESLKRYHRTHAPRPFNLLASRRMSEYQTRKRL